MLVLTRRQSERVRVRTPDGTDIWIEVVAFVHGNKVRLGFSAPPNVTITREELIAPAAAPETPHA